MLTSKLLLRILYIPLLILLQVILFNNMVVFNGYVPLFYVVYILFYNPQENNILFLFLAFILGLSLDIATYTPGVNAFACVLIAYIRPYIFILINNSNFELDYFSFSKFNYIQIFIYILIVVFIHHFAIHLIEGLKLTLFFPSLLKSFLGAILSSIFIFIFYLFLNKE